MTYLAITQKTAAWLLSKSYFSTLARNLTDLATERALDRGVISAGPLRVTATRDRGVIALWNVDYLTSTGDESWGLIRLDGEFGILAEPQIAREVLEHDLQLIDRRLQGLLLDSAWEIRSKLPGVTTCIAGRGAAWQRHRTAYLEAEVALPHSSVRGVLLIGPAWENDAYCRFAQGETSTLHAGVAVANALLTESLRRPALEHRLFSELRHAIELRSFDGLPVSVPAMTEAVDSEKAFDSLHLRYDDWVAPGSRLSSLQRAVLEADIVNRQPVRIVGAAGSGKTLLMMLIAIRKLRRERENQQPCSIVYIAHNSAMRDKVTDRFLELGAEEFIKSEGNQQLRVLTLFDHAREVLSVSDLMVIDKDAQASKDFQLSVTRDVLRDVMHKHLSETERSPIFKQALSDERIFEVVAALIADEIAVAIKGQGLSNLSDKRLYVDSQRSLSRLHGQMSDYERELVWLAFLEYHEVIADENELLDAGDLALSLLGRLRTPLWELKRRQEAFDLIVVDEAQLFDENERRLFPLLAKHARPFVPLALALDQAQATRANSTAGLGLLGLDDLSSQTLETVHRCSPSILRLAFLVIQQTTDLFGPDFPDFTASTRADPSLSAGSPTALAFVPELESTSSFIARMLGTLRKRNKRRIAVVCFSDRYWRDALSGAQSSGLPLKVMMGRGEALGPNRQPLIVVARPEQVGGQEFDVVVCIGLEQGIVPLRVQGNEALSSTLEQQALREMYLVFTRAKTDLVCVVTPGAVPSPVLQSAVSAGLLARDRTLE